MTELENYMTKYYYAIKTLRRLNCELEAATREYEDGIGLYPGHGYDAIRSKNKKVADPTAVAAILLADSLGAIVERIRHEIIGEQSTVNEITALIDASGIYGREKEYVRLRYLEDKPATKVQMELQRIYNKDFSQQTCLRIRAAALDKLQTAYDRVSRQGNGNIQADNKVS